MGLVGTFEGGVICITGKGIVVAATWCENGLSMPPPPPGEEGLMRRREAGIRDLLSVRTFFKFRDFSLMDLTRISDFTTTVVAVEKVADVVPPCGDGQGEGEEEAEFVGVPAAVFGFFLGLYL